MDRARRDNRSQKMNTRAGMDHILPSQATHLPVNHQMDWGGARMKSPMESKICI